MPWIHSNHLKQNQEFIQKCMRRGTCRPRPAGDGEMAELMRKRGSRTSKLERGPLFKRLFGTAERYRIRRSEGTAGNYSWLCPSSCTLTPVALPARSEALTHKYVRWCIHSFVQPEHLSFPITSESAHQEWGDFLSGQCDHENTGRSFILSDGEELACYVTPPERPVETPF